MKTVIPTIVCRGADLEVGDKFYTYNRKTIEWKVMVTVHEGELKYGTAISKEDNMFFKANDIFIVEELG